MATPGHGRINLAFEDSHVKFHKRLGIVTVQLEMVRARGPGPGPSVVPRLVTLRLPRPHWAGAESEIVSESGAPAAAIIPVVLESGPNKNIGAPTGVATAKISWPFRPDPNTSMKKTLSN